MDTGMVYYRVYRSKDTGKICAQSAFGIYGKVLWDSRLIWAGRASDPETAMEAGKANPDYV